MYKDLKEKQVQLVRQDRRGLRVSKETLDPPATELAPCQQRTKSEQALPQLLRQPGTLLYLLSALGSTSGRELS